jgi:tetratricopeptide (TPR) repeat protein
MFGYRACLALAATSACVGVDAAWADELPATKAESVADGNDSSRRERAKQLFEDGLSAYRAGKYSDAIDKLIEADRVMPNAAFSYNIGLVYEAKGDPRSALRWLRNYLRQSSADQSTALQKVKKLEAQLEAQGLQQVSVLSEPPGATLTIDGLVLGITPFTTELVPGSHVAVLSLRGYQRAQRTFELRADRSMDVDVALAVATPEGKPKPTGAPTAKPIHQPSVVVRPSPAAPLVALQPHPRVTPWTWISLGVGTALLGGALGFEVKRRHEESDAAAAASQVEFQEHYSRIEPAQVMARALAAAGSVVVATGVGLLVFDLTRSGPARTSDRAGSLANGFCAELRGQF